jgi:hypothetical protein
MHFTGINALNASKLQNEMTTGWFGSMAQIHLTWNYNTAIGSKKLISRCSKYG